MGATSILRDLKLFWPALLGMAFTRTGLIVSGYGAYESTDEGLFTDGAMLLSLAVVFVMFFVVAEKKPRLSHRAYDRMLYISLVVEFLCVVVLAFDFNTPISRWGRLFFCALASLATCCCMIYWTTGMRGRGGAAAVLFAFGSLATSEVFIYICDILDFYGFIIASVLVLLQPFCHMLLSRTQEQGEAAEKDSTGQNMEMIGFAKSLLDNNRLLCITAMGVALLFIVDGLLRGYPSGAPIHFTPETRICNTILTIVLSFVIIMVVYARNVKALNIQTFLSLELLAAIALLVYAAFPDNLEMGAVFTTTLNALLCGLMWHITIAFATFGWRDPLYYAFGSWVVCMGSRALARVVLTFANFNVQDELIINASMFATLLVSTQILLCSLYAVAKKSMNNTSDETELEKLELTQRISELKEELRLKDQEQQGGNLLEACAAATSCINCSNACVNKAKHNATSQSTLSRLMGLDKPVEGDSSPQATMRRRAEEVGKQFLLSEREVEVLSLYALGWTQKRVAEELFIQPGTVHAHIKRIYSKTNLHSRQEILDYMEQYVA